MKRSAHGYKPVAGYLTERLASMQELQHETMPEYVLKEYAPLLDSSDMQPENWQHIADDIKAHYDAFDGFVILHGTDTMAYTASALSFLLENLAKPVILTGSQIPLVEVRSDARENLITSLLLAANEPIPEVCLYLNGRLLRGNRSKKVNSRGFNAFDSPNFPPLATVGIDINVRRDLLQQASGRPLEVPRLRDVQVAALRLFPGITAPILNNFLSTPVQGLVLETYGAGNAPMNAALLQVLKDACDRGVVVVNCSQCLRGRVDMRSYETGQQLESIGVVSGLDMTAEAALGKLMVLLSTCEDVGRVRALMPVALRGELS